MYLKWNNKVLHSNANFPVNTTLSAYDITQFTPGPSNSRQGQGQNRNSTGHPVPQYAPTYSLVLNAEKMQRCTIFIVFNIAGLLWCIVQYT